MSGLTTEWLSPKEEGRVSSGVKAGCLDFASQKKTEEEDRGSDGVEVESSNLASLDPEADGSRRDGVEAGCSDLASLGPK